jgi:hypothetical protein
MSRVRRPFRYDRFILVTVNHAGVRAERQERRCGLRIDRVRLPTDGGIHRYEQRKSR